MKVKPLNIVVVEDTRIFRRYWERWYKNNPKYQRGVNAEFRWVSPYQQSQIVHLVYENEKRGNPRPLTVVILGAHVLPEAYRSTANIFGRLRQLKASGNGHGISNVVVSDYEDSKVPVSSYFRVASDSDGSIELEFTTPSDWYKENV